MQKQALAPHVEPAETADSEAPARRCHRYLAARRKHLFYDEALAADLPTGSGEIESAHCYVAQQRLKRPGAWWKQEHAEYMLALRVTRINGDWETYWSSLKAKPDAANHNTPQSLKCPRRMTRTTLVRTRCRRQTVPLSR